MYTLDRSLQLRYSFAFACSAESSRVAAAAASTTALRSLTFVANSHDSMLMQEDTERMDSLKITLFPSFHISVIRVSPGYTTPAKLR